MKRLTEYQVLALHSQLISVSGGDNSVRDYGLFESALAAPFQSFGGVEMYPTVLQKAARLGFGLVMNHPFVDGNKRTGAHTMLVFLALNGVKLAYTQKELSDVIYGVASGEIPQELLLGWLAMHQDV